MARKRNTAHVLRITAATLVIVAIGALAARSLDWPGVLRAMGRASPPWLAAAIVANALILLLWAAYWRRLTPTAHPVSVRRMFEIVSVTSSVMNTIPFGAGHATGAVLLVKRGGLTQHSALSVIVLDQLGEGVAKTMIYLLVALLAPLPGWMHEGILMVSLGVAALLATLLVAAHWYADHPERVPGHDETRFGRAREYVARSAKGLETLRSWRRSGVALLWVLGMKAAEIAGIALVQVGFGVHIGFGPTLLVISAKVLGTMIPVAPANVGTFEASVFLAYRAVGLPPEVAAALALVQHACFFLPSAGIGYALMAKGIVRAR